MAANAGSEPAKLIVLRGNSASGKTSVATGIRNRYGRGIAIVSQDNLRRTVLRERDTPGGTNIGLIDTVARYALNHGFHAIVEGILYSGHYADMITGLREAHPGVSFCYYFDVPFEETMRRHATKPQAAEYGSAEMSDWYHPLDLLPDGVEQIIPAEMSLDDTVSKVMADADLHDPAEPLNRLDFAAGAGGRRADLHSSADRRPLPTRDGATPSHPQSSARPGNPP
jgi:predicted kinase